VVTNAPTAGDDAYTTDEDVALNVAAPGVLGNDSDGDGDPLTAALVSGPSNGGLTLNADGSFTYTPDADFNGSDSFTYVANDGTQDSNVATVTITVNGVNDAPSATFTHICIGLSCDFDASGSSDLDGTIAIYDWDFGDGNTGTGVTASHTYAAAGTYTVVLTVTDDGGATATDTQSVTSSEPSTVHVADLDGSSVDAPRSRWEATVTITVHDRDEGVVPGALVEGVWGGGTQGGDSCTTDASGQCSVTKNNLKDAVSSVTFSVSNVSSGAGAYASDDNHDPDGDSDGITITVAKPVANTPPTVSITAPADGSTFESEATISFAGSASDAEDGDVTASLVWTSDIDGQVGTGADFSAALSDGVHTITATATDSGGASSSDVVGVTVGNPPTVHVGRLDGTSAPVRSKWQATVTVTVHDQDHVPVTNAVVAGTWSNGATGGAQCTTDSNGQCSVTVGNLKLQVPSVTFAVDSLIYASYAYAWADNHDPDGDGTVIVVSQP
jgi:VCBS repeat-containing protein